MNIFAMDAPALPGRWLVHVGLALGWGVVLAWLGVTTVSWLAVRRAGRPMHRLQVGTAVVLLAATVLLPGPWSPAYWLGLAFQMPSLLSVLLCGVLLHRTLTQQLLSEGVVRSSRNSLLALAVMGAGLGWVLLLDTFALLPAQVYVWGFSPVAVALVLLACLLPWVLSFRGPLDPLAWTPPVAVLLFVVLRLPSGNVWDAVLDPWLWVVLQVVVVRRWRGGP